MFLLLTLGILGTQKSTEIVLNELYNPEYIIAGKDFLLIEDNQEFKMYGLRDFKLILSFGKRGEGPGAFMEFAYPQILSDSIMVGSMNKVSFFNFEGKLIKELRTKMIRPRIKIINNKYVADSLKPEPDDIYLLYNLYNPDFEKEKTFHKGKAAFHKNGQSDLFEIYFFDVYNGKIIFAHRDGSMIEILNDNGDRLKSIKIELPKIPFTDEDKNRLFKDMEINIKYKDFVNHLKTRGIPPQYYPSIRTCQVADGKIYVITYLKQNKRSECLVFNLEGKKLRRIFIPLHDVSENVSPVFTIDRGYLYQLVEDFENEKWELVVEKIE